MYIYTSRDFCKFYRHRVAADEMSFYAFGGILLCWQAEPSLALLFAVASKFHVRTAVYNRGTLGPAFFVLLRYPLFSLWKSIWRGSHSWYICYVNFGDTKKKKKIKKCDKILKMKPLLIHQQCSIWASAILILCWTSGICGIQWL